MHDRSVFRLVRGDHAERWGRPGEIHVPIQAATDVVDARTKGREFARLWGMSSAEATIVAAMISELARNILLYARRGEVIVTAVDDGGRLGVGVTAREERDDDIADYPAALAERLLDWECRLDGVRRLADEFEIASEVGKGTIVTIRKWKR